MSASALGDSLQLRWKYGMVNRSECYEEYSKSMCGRRRFSQLLVLVANGGEVTGYGMVLINKILFKRLRTHIILLWCTLIIHIPSVNSKRYVCRLIDISVYSCQSQEDNFLILHSAPLF